jgi:hypothetical protein
MRILLNVTRHLMVHKPALLYGQGPNKIIGGRTMSADGSWKVTINSPMGAQQATMNLVTDGDSLSGSMESPQGTQEFAGGTVNGDNLEWIVEVTSPMPMKLEVSAAVDGDSISGNVKLGAFGEATFAGERA